MTRRELNNLMLKVNKICFSDKFKKLFTEKFGIEVPEGLTYYVTENSSILYFKLVIKKYGIERSTNNGVAEYSNAYDFSLGDSKIITDEYKDFVREYFIHHELPFYNKYMRDAIIK